MKLLSHKILGLILLMGILCFVLPQQSIFAAPPADIHSFVITVKTDNPGTSADTAFTIQTYPGETYDYNVNCDDIGSYNAWNQTGDYTCDYGPTGSNTGAGIYTIRIQDNSGTGDGFPRIYLNNTGDKEKLLSVDQWGTGNWTSMDYAFQGAKNLTITATDAPDLAGVTSAINMFAECSVLNSDLNHWDVSTITNMRGMFAETKAFNGDLSSWDVSNVTDMYVMFHGALDFNGDLSSWDVSSVETMGAMFAFNYDFNGDISGWIVSNVTDMGAMFYDAINFNQDLSGWDVSNVTDMGSMFCNSFAFDQNLGGWDVSSLTAANSMFAGTALSTVNYDALLEGWNAQVLQNGVPFNGGNSTYCYAGAARENMVIADGWTITDGGRDCSYLSPAIFGPPDGHSTTDHTPNFDWDDVPGATNYVIQVSPRDDFSILPINHTVTNSFFAPGISMINQQYWWRVIANLDGELSGWSEVRTITITGAPGNAAPVALSPVDGFTTTNRRPTFDWTDVPDVARYRIQISNSAGFGFWIVNQTSTVSTWTPGINMNPGTYWWRVQAEGGGDSSWFTIKRSITIEP